LPGTSESLAQFDGLLFLRKVSLDGDIGNLPAAGSSPVVEKQAPWKLRIKVIVLSIFSKVWPLGKSRHNNRVFPLVGQGEGENLPAEAEHRLLHRPQTLQIVSETDSHSELQTSEEVVPIKICQSNEMCN
jgi:hypothetical protein